MASKNPIHGERQIHLGCGPHHLPAPWENYDREVDIERPLPFKTNGARFIHAEHLIEHVPFLAGWHFLHECYRVLDFGGTLRLAFPDVTRFAEFGNETYLEFLKNTLQLQARTRADVTKFILTGSEHQAAWTEALGRLVLEAVGFRHVVSCAYGTSARRPLHGVDCHHLSAPRAVVRAETTILEGTR